MEGVTFFEDESIGLYLCVINDLSSDLKSHIQRNLILICEGEYHSEKFSSFLSYQNTLLTFMERYSKKKKSTQIGLIGELLCHLLLPERIKTLKVISPYFNIEESSIKKGHDLVLFSPSDEEIWITEVKSGEKGQAQSTTKKVQDLFNIANNDLQGKFVSTGTNLWRNALKGMDTALKDGITKGLIEKQLSEYQSATLTGKQKPDVYNAILCSCVFYNAEEEVDFNELSQWKAKFKGNEKYKNVVLFAIQKSTYIKVINFLEKEASEALKEGA